MRRPLLLVFIFLLFLSFVYTKDKSLDNIKDKENITIEGFDFNGAEAPRLVDFEITDNSWRECTGNCAIDGVEISNVNVLTNLNGVESQIFGKDDVHNINNVIIRDCRVLGRSISSSVDINLSVNPFVKKIFFISD